MRGAKWGQENIIYRSVFQKYLSAICARTSSICRRCKRSTSSRDFIRNVIKVIAGLAGLVATGFFVAGGFTYIT